MDFWTSLATNDKEGQTFFEMTVKEKNLEFGLSFHLSYPMTSMRNKKAFDRPFDTSC